MIPLVHVCITLNKCFNFLLGNFCCMLVRAWEIGKWGGGGAGPCRSCHRYGADTTQWGIKIFEDVLIISLTAHPLLRPPPFLSVSYTRPLFLICIFLTPPPPRKKKLKIYPHHPAPHSIFTPLSSLTQTAREA